MGLDTTHDCWHGPYSAFHRWRVAVAKAVGIDLENMRGFAIFGETNDDIPWESLAPDIVHVLLNHSDCEGEIAAEDCGPLADRLEELLPLLDDTPHHSRFRTDRERARQFIAGLRLAVKNNEPVEFH